MGPLSRRSSNSGEFLPLTYSPTPAPNTTTSNQSPSPILRPKYHWPPQSSDLSSGLCISARAFPPISSLVLASLSLYFFLVLPPTPIYRHPGDLSLTPGLSLIPATLCSEHFHA